MAPDYSVLDKGFKDGINSSKKNKERWGEHDSIIKTAVDCYSRYLTKPNIYNKTPPPFPLKWYLVKAVIWMETNPFYDPEQWKKRPMQIGNTRDAGIDDVAKTGGRCQELIIPDDWKKKLQDKNKIRNDHEYNIYAGIALLLHKLAKYRAMTDTSDPSIHQYTAASGDNISRISKHENTTEEFILGDFGNKHKDKDHWDETKRSKILSGSKNEKTAYYKIRVGDVIDYYRSSVQIGDWQSTEPENVARLYNSEKTDKNYSIKLHYCLDALKEQGFY